MAGPRITEVSLALYAVIARAEAIRPLQEVLSLARISPGSWRTCLCGFGFWPAYRNVPDECVFGFQGAERGCSRWSMCVWGSVCLSSQGVAGEKGKNITTFKKFLKKFSESLSNWGLVQICAHEGSGQDMLHPWGHTDTVRFPIPYFTRKIFYRVDFFNKSGYNGYKSKNEVST